MLGRLLGNNGLSEATFTTLWGCFVPEADIKSIASVNLSGRGILSLIAFLVPSEVLHPFLNNLK